MSPAKRTSVALCAALACSLALGGVASAAPAGDEYLPKVPSASGHGGGGGGAGGAGGGATGSSSSVTPSSGAAGGGGSPASGGGGPKDKKTPHAKQTVTPVTSTDTGSSDGGGSSGLLIGLLIVAGVIVAAVGMTLRQRGASGDAAVDTGAAAERGPAQGTRPTTPDGEIVAGRDKA